MRPQEIGLEGTRAEPDARPVLSEMVSQLMPLRHEPSHQRLLTSEPVRDQEKCRPRRVPPQLGEDQRGGGRIRPIVDR